MKPIPETYRRDDWPRLVAQVGNKAARDGAWARENVENSSGWEFVDDTAAATQAIAAATATQVTIADGGPGTDRSRLPADMASIWDTATNTIAGVNGDSRDCQFMFTFTPDDGTASYLDLWIDIGGGFPPLFPDHYDILGGAGVAVSRFYNFICFNADTWEANGGKIMAQSDGPGVLSNKSLLINIEHRNRD
jgi:hypothetical protein